MKSTRSIHQHKSLSHELRASERAREQMKERSGAREQSEQCGAGKRGGRQTSEQAGVNGPVLYIYFLHTVDWGVRKVNVTWLQEGCRRYVHSWWFVTVSPYSNQEANDRGAWFWQKCEKQPVSVFIKNLICILSSILFKQLEAMSGPSEWSCFMQYKHKDSLKPQASPCQCMIPLRCFITMNGVVSWDF